jgi:hypothetical protein
MVKSYVDFICVVNADNEESAQKKHKKVIEECIRTISEIYPNIKLEVSSLYNAIELPEETE